MSTLELPHTPGCLVCGRDNPRGLKLSSHVDPNNGVVKVTFVPTKEMIGFEHLVHGGIVATVMDEAMVWAATWQGKRVGVCGELSIRFRRGARVGETLLVEARVEFSRPKLIQAAATMRTPSGGVVAAAEGKYVPMEPEYNDRVFETLVDEPETHAAFLMLKGATPVVE
jgi:acyl-coenzyme A thioesterase PaaI-like protein